jgi:recombination protein RecT
VRAMVVYKNDKFAYREGTKPVLEHEPMLDGESGDPICVYSVAWIKGCAMPHIEVMTVGEVNSIRDRSRARDSGPWQTDWSEMARKTAVRRIAKYLPMSSELVRALEVEDAAETGSDSPVLEMGPLFADEVGEPEQLPPTRKPAQLAAKIRANTIPVETSEPVPVAGATKEEREAAFRAKSAKADEPPPPEYDGPPMSDGFAG